MWRLSFRPRMSKTFDYGFVTDLGLFPQGAAHVVPIREFTKSLIFEFPEAVPGCLKHRAQKAARPKNGRPLQNRFGSGRSVPRISERNGHCWFET